MQQAAGTVFLAPLGHFCFWPFQWSFFVYAKFLV